MNAVGVDEYHGCPYKHINSQALKQLLEASNILPQSMVFNNSIGWYMIFIRLSIIELYHRLQMFKKY